MKHDREDKPLNVQKGEYELLRILRFIKDTGYPVTTEEIARGVVGRDDEVTLRRVRRKLNLLEREGFVKSIGKSPKKWCYCAVTFVIIDDDTYKRHIKYIIAGLVILAGSLISDSLLKTLPEPEREEIESLINCGTALRNKLRLCALSHLEYGYPEVFALYKEREKAVDRYCSIKRDFQKAVSDALKQRFKYAVFVESTNFIKPDPESRAYYVYSDRVMSTCQEALSNYTQNLEYLSVNRPRKMRFYFEGDKWGIVKTEGGIIVGVGDTRLLHDFHSFSKDVCYYLRSYGPEVRRWFKRLVEYSIRLRDEMLKIIHELRQGILRGICPTCLLAVKSKKTCN